MARRAEDDEVMMEQEIEEEARIGDGHDRPERRRAGTHKRKQSRRRRRRRWLLIPGILAVLLVIGLVVFRVQTLQIEGTQRVSEETVKQLIRWDSCQGNSLLLWLLNRRVDVTENALVADIDVRLADPWTVVAQVDEERLVGCVQIGEQYFYVNEEGRVILSQTEKMEEVPLLDGLEIEKAETGSALAVGNVGVLDDLLDIAKCLEDFDISTDGIEQAAEGGYRILMGSVKVLVGRDVYMDEKISELKDLLPELEGLSGTLHLEDYDSTKDSIIFTKDS